MRIRDVIGEGNPKADAGEGGRTIDDPVDVALQFCNNNKLKFKNSFQLFYYLFLLE